MRYYSLCTGVGGLDRAMDPLGHTAATMVEIDPYCNKVLDLRYPGVARHDDLRTFAPKRGSAELIIGGPPCQPVSHAGRRKGAGDHRWLWGDALRIVNDVRPEIVFFENPMGLRTLGLDTILATLSGMGYGGAWEVVAAADVGAPHLRKRIFIMGVRGRFGWEGPTRPKGNRGIPASLWPTPSLPGGGRTIPDGADWHGRTTAYHEGKKLQVGLDSAVREWPEDCRPVSEVFGRPVQGAFSHRFRTSAKIGDPCICGATTKDVDEDVAVSRTPVLWPSPNASGERPNEGNVRLLRQRVLDGTLTEDEARGMLNGKSPFEAQGKVPALWPTPHGNVRGAADGSFDGHGSELSQAVLVAEGLSESGRSAKRVPGHIPTPTARLGGERGPQAKRYFDPARSNDLDDYVAAFPANTWPTPTSRDYKDTGDSIANGTVPVNGLLGRAVGPTRESGSLNPDWVEWLMNWPIGWTDITRAEPGLIYGWEKEPAIPRVGLGIPNRSKRLTAIGNGVVTKQALFAWHRLSERLGL